VTPDGYYLKLNTKPGAVIVTPKEPFNCKTEGHREIASCITIPNAKSATKVWLAFSDAQWSEAVRARHNAESYRKQHMRCVDVKAFASSVDAKHCFSIKEIGKKVAEYSLNTAALKKATQFSEFTAQERFGQDKLLLEQCESLYPGKGFTVVLDDPVGVAAELAALMNYRVYAFKKANKDDRLRKLYVSEVVGALEKSVKDDARLGVEKQAAAAAIMDHMMVGGADDGQYFEKFRENQRKKGINVGAQVKKNVEDAQIRSWAKYQAKFKEQEMKDWQKLHEQELKDLDKNMIEPLALAHTKWMKSTIIQHYFECNYDNKSAESGIVYAKAVTQCLQGVQDKGASFDLIYKWLDGDITDKNNFILSALVLNQEKTKVDIKKAMTVSLDWRGLPLDPIAGSFALATSNVIDHKPDVMAHYLAVIAGAFGKLLMKASDGIVRSAMVACSMHMEQRFTVVTINGTRKAFVSMLTREIVQHSGQHLNKSQLSS
jgi:hypothetical protein